MNSIYIYTHEKHRLEISFPEGHNCLSFQQQYKPDAKDRAYEDRWYDKDEMVDIEFFALPELIKQLQRVEKLLVLK